MRWDRTMVFKKLLLSFTDVKTRSFKLIVSKMLPRGTKRRPSSAVFIALSLDRHPRNLASLLDQPFFATTQNVAVDIAAMVTTRVSVMGHQSAVALLVCY
jgi:hypothetical protein